LKLGFKKDFFSDSIFSAINSIATVLKPFALIYLVNNYFGAEAYGKLAVFLSSLSFVLIMSSLGVGFSMTRHILGEKNNVSRKHYFYAPINFQLILLCIYFLIAFCYVVFGNVEVSITELGLYCFYYLSFILFQYFLEFRRWVLNVKGYAAVYLVYSITFLSFLGVGFRFELLNNIEQVLIVDAAIMFIIFIYLFRSVFKQLGFSYKTFSRKGLFKEIKLGMPFALGGLGEVIVSAADRFMIVFFFGLFEAGLYSSGYMLGSIPLFFVRFIGLFLPQHMFSGRDSGDDDYVNNLVNFSLFSFYAISIPYVYFLVLFGSEILTFINITSDDALTSMIIISIASIGFGSYLLMCSVSLMEKKTSFQMKLILSLSLFNLVANYFAMSLFDSFVAASLVTLVTYILLTVIFLKYLKTIWSFDFSTKFFVAPAVLASLSYVLVKLLELNYPLLLTQSFVLGAMVFLSVYLIGLVSFLLYSKTISIKKWLLFR
tara:strand:- start:1216 stop:2676 length:1461 start_codon:yes stop_codon:yes gene_type:complete